jgi:hypothetical protein
MRIEVVIDELVLIGIDARDRHRTADAIAHELSARVSREDVMRLAHTEGGVPVLRAPDVAPLAGAHGVTPDAIGAGIATAIGASLSAARFAPHADSTSER